MSTRSRQMEQNHSMVGPNYLIQMSVDSLCTQSVSKSHMSVGEGIMTRTISFHHDLYDSPSVSTAQKTSACFEMRLSRWLLERICGRTPTMTSVMQYKSTDCIKKLCKYLRDNPSEHRRVVQDCLKFIKLYGITHYVYSIQLGANRFRFLSSSEYKKKVSRTATAGTANIAKSSLGTTSSWWHRSSSMNVQEIGTIEDGRVKDSSLTSKVEPPPKEEPLAPLPHYLNGGASIFGYNEGPLEVKLNVTAENARFVLHSRVSDDYTPVDLNSWEHGEAFYINCSRHRFKWEGYVSIKETKAQKYKLTAAHQYITAIVPTEHSHNDVDTWLLFRLIRVKGRDQEEDNCTEGLTEQEERAKFFEAITNAGAIDLERYT